MFTYLAKTTDFLRIKDSHIGLQVWALPALASVVFTAGCMFGNVDIWGKDAAASKMGSFFGILSGFFVASMVAISTLESEYLNGLFENTNKPKLIHGVNPDRSKRKSNPEILTRRKFLGLLFGYISMSSIALTLVGIFSDVFDGCISRMTAFLVVNTVGYAVLIIRVVACFILMFAAIQAISIAFIGFHFLSDRVLDESAKKSD